MRRRDLLLAGVGLLAGCSSSSRTVAPTVSGSGAAADLLIHGGPILTMDPARPVVEAIAVAHDRIVALGQKSELADQFTDEAKVIDLHGATLMPGFVDAHSHFFGRADAAGTDMENISTFIAGLGITTTAECFVDPDLLGQLRQIGRRGLITVRLSAYLAANNACGDPLGDWWAAIPPTRSPGERLRIGGVKVYADGGACHAPAASYEYANGGGHGDLYFSVATLASLLGHIDAVGHQAAIHALGDRAVETTLGALEQVVGSSGNPKRHRIEHSAATRPDLRERHGKVGAVVTVFGAYPTCFLTGDNHNFKYRAPAQYLEWEWPWRSLIDASPGAHFAWHADFPVFQPPDPIHCLDGFVNRAQVASDGSVCQPTAVMKANAITVDEALRLMTTGAAYALFRENEVGRLAPGLFADFVVLSDDPTAVAAAKLRDIQVLTTIVGGSSVWCRPGHEALCPTI